MSEEGRPPVDVVVPFFGSDDELAALRQRMAALRYGPRDTVTIVDNRPGPPGAPTPGDDVLAAPEVQSSYFARNRGVARGTAPWLVFLDADIDIDPDLIERYFEPLPADATGLMGGTVETPPGRGRVVRYGVLRNHVGNANVSTPGNEYVQTANAAVRRAAFEDVGGFPEDIRSGGDADLSFRVRDAGWSIEARPGAVVSHPPRSSLKAMLRVYGRYGSGAQWLKGRHPSFAPSLSLPRLVLSLLITPAMVLLRRVRSGPDAALMRTIDPMVTLAFELGRFQPNRRAGRGEVVRHALAVLAERRRSA